MRVGLLWMVEHAASKAGNGHQRMFWQRHNKPIELWRQDVIEQRLNYIHQNPVKAGYVNEKAQWLYSGTLNFAGSKGLINVELLFYFWPAKGFVRQQGERKTMPFLRISLSFIQFYKHSTSPGFKAVLLLNFINSSILMRFILQFQARFNWALVIYYYGLFFGFLLL